MPCGLQSAPTGLPEATIPFGNYELLERINIGGMAEILKARDLSREDRGIIAVKRILPHLTDDRQFVTMFKDESRVLAQLEHENIIRTLEIGEVNETPFIALEFVWGQDARMLFHRARRDEQPTPIGLSCYVIAQVCSALHYAHELTDANGDLLGVVHRDISLQNVLISYDGAVKLTDFGIAMSAENRARTEAGVVKGKFGYMSPEQIRGEPMDRRSDVFATGICLYELLTNERLFSGDSDYAAVEKVRNVAIEPPSRLNREIPSALEAIVMKALAKHPRDRFQNAAELRRALLQFMSESHEECSAKDLAEHMRAAFAEELRLAPTPEVLRRELKQRETEPTGLAAFDNLDPVSALSGASAVHEMPASREELAAAAPGRPREPGVPMVPPVVPRRDSIPAPHARSNVYSRPEAPSGPQLGLSGAESTNGGAPASAVGIGLDWDDDEARTQTERLDPVPGFPTEDELPHDDDVTRQIHVGETFSGVSIAGASGVRPVVANGNPSPFGPAVEIEPAPAAPREPSQRTTQQTISVHPMPQTSYGVVIGIVIGIVAVIAGALWLTQGSRPATLQLTTSPADASVRVDGELRAGARSPFNLDDLAPDQEHHVEVFKDGYRGWSSHITLSPGQVLSLPPVRLVPAGAEGPRVIPDETPAAPPAPVPEKPVTVRPKSDSPNVERKPRPREAPRPSPPPQPRVAAAPSAPAKGQGVLRLNSRPWSQVTIDGKRVGNTPLMNQPLSAGTHTVKLVNPDFKLTKSIKVQIKSGETLTKVVDLQ
jgi:serine/threonine protein kinase